MSTYKKYMETINIGKSVDTQTAELKKAASARRIKHMRVMTLSAAAVMACTATAAAAGRDIISIASRWLNIGEEQISRNLTEVSTSVSLNTFEDLQIVPRGIFSDGGTQILFLDITRTDGILDCSPYELQMADGSPYIYRETGETVIENAKVYFDAKHAMALTRDEKNNAVLDSYLIPCQACVLDDDDPADGNVTMAVYFDAEQAGLDAETTFFLYLQDLKASRYFVVEDNENSMLLDSTLTDSISGVWQGTITFSPEPNKRLTLENAGDTVLSAYPQNRESDGSMKNRDVTFSVDEIRITEMTAGFTVSAERPTEMLFLNSYKIAEIIMKDGSTVPVCPETWPSNNDGCKLFNVSESGNLPSVNEVDRWVCRVSAMLPDGIGLDNVADIRIGSEIFHIN